jgi:SNF2 family DNA or RNA helicase
MGIGKSAQAISSCDFPNERVLIIGPAVARLNWIEEFKKFSKNNPPPFPVQSEKKFTGLESRSYVVSYDLAINPKVKEKLLKQGRFDTVILDEAHYLKEHKTKRTAAVLGPDGYGRNTTRIIALSGTPMPNHPGELWVFARTFGWTTLSYEAWIERYCETSFDGYKTQIHGAVKDKAMRNELAELLRENMLRRKKEDVLKELPPITFQQVFVEAGAVDIEIEATFGKWLGREAQLKAQMSSDDAFLLKLLKEAEPAQRIEILKAMAKSVSTLRMYSACQKVQPIADMVGTELDDFAYKKIVIFAHHQGLIEGLRQKLKRHHPLTLYGGTPDEKRAENIRKFQTEDKYRVFIGNIKACGTAVTLTAADEALFAEQSWVPADNAQAAMRVHRIGQHRPVRVRTVSIYNSVDEHVTRVLDRKMQEILEIIG